jgi:hypothetical protein
MLDSTYLVSIFVLGVIGWVAYKIFIWPFYVSPLRKIPGPPSENIFYGNFKTIMTDEVNVVYYISLNYYFLQLIHFLYIYIL